MSKCDTCNNRLKVWGDKLSSEGYTGCCIGWDDFQSKKADDIEAETVGWGWVIAGGGGLVNGQIIVREVTECRYYEETRRRNAT